MPLIRPVLKSLLLLLFCALTALLSSPITLAQGGSNNLHLPLIQGYRPVPKPNVFGGEIIPSSEEIVAPLTRDAGMTWTRFIEVEWAAVEPSPRARHWESLAGLERSLTERSAAGLTNIVNIGHAPAWARQVPSRDCSLIKPEALDEFADFMEAFVERYSRPPYYVNHYEIYNEPDVDPDFATTNQNFGCWGDQDDPNYGGGYYSQMLSTIYPRIKAANPNAQVLIGGLLLDCDYTHDYPEIGGRNCNSARFLRGILEHGRGTNFDAVAFHGYPIHTLGRNDWERGMYLWAHRNGVVVGKAQFIREELAAYGLERPLFLTESALICYEGASCNADQTLLRQDQANYVVRLYSRAIANDLTAAVWYSVNDPGWRYVGLLNYDHTPRPAYHALSFMTDQLGNATFVGTLGSGTNEVEGYAFRSGTRTIHLYWSNSTQAYSVPFPQGATLFDKMGNPLPPPITNTLLVGFEPVYVIQG